MQEITAISRHFITDSAVLLNNGSASLDYLRT